MRKGKLRYLWLLFAILFLFFTGNMRESVQDKNKEFKLNPNTSTDNTPPPELSIAMSLGVFRSMLIDIIWMRAGKLQQEKRFYEIVQLYDLIGKLQPYNGAIWQYSGWNMAYNISVELPPGEERWRWVKNGINRIKFQGLKFNPDDRRLFKEIAWIYSHKVGKNMDDSHLLYKTRMVEEMQDVFSGFKGTANDLLKDLKSDNPVKKAEAEVIQLKLKNNWKMDLQLMADLENSSKYGPLDWRIPETHCFYWAEQGLKRPDDLLKTVELERLIYQAQQYLLRKGTVIHLPAFGNRPSSVMSLPDYRQAKPMLDMFLRQIELFKKEGHTIRGVKSAFHFYVQEGVEILTFAGENERAEEFYKYANSKFPGVVEAHTAKDFIRDNLTKRLKDMNGDQFASLISSTLLQHFFWKARGDKKKSNALMKQAEELWNLNKEVNSSANRQINRSFKEIYKANLINILWTGMLHPSDIKLLRLELDETIVKEIDMIMEKQRKAFLERQKQARSGGTVPKQ